MQQDQCPHTELFDGMCVLCGKDMSHNLPNGYVPNNELIMRKEDIQKEKESIDKYLMDNKKLALVIDLDRTLIDTIIVKNEEEAKRIIDLDPENKSDLFYFMLDRLYLVRIRPHVHEFLEKLAPFYIMHLDTLSQRSYAEIIMKKIDPTDVYFRGRIRCRDERKLQTKTIESFILSDKYTIALDDTPDVWQQENDHFDFIPRRPIIYHNLIQLEPFLYFKSFPDGKKEISQRAANDTTLQNIADIMVEKIHHKFFEKQTENVFLTICDLKLSVLRDCYIMFSNAWNEEDTLQRNKIISRAEQFGANIVVNFCPYVTHIVGFGPPQTVADEAAKYKGIFIVHMAWFDYSCLRFNKEDEYRYQIPGYQMVTNGDLPRTDPPPEEEIGSTDFDDLMNGDTTESSSDYSDDDAYSEDISFLGDN
ncbi:NLI interacting factor-like phosphatase family protein [Histomonas meleagridis]|uniref:NLI interacting factor-like phosphatase family protein n=1 Tax=Histomonas meleagridis TaxID=135588 RepID=UPI00355A4F2F|nr:NLI interacting factor-like phosphatase family protein [Histomonas meleagridis]KAH0803055.1 NLI interacting factor-like phosphatase family protein [Histomonas meleagridis]